ncbi:hypothetical protein BB560_004336 [Smittium megazygosporum]|uniref:DUF2470 domain-containing protein n=1 Tax=Smittium megazygosporum TaxID=133381 RepID=A0A2T9Z434_9FUNG|nr:hypothetical protein BB560_005521 [Smittium megazygosporum]PVV01252.1 hypothetical protein BB560_004336 [Smittium megazygosporum]
MNTSKRSHPRSVNKSPSIKGLDLLMNELNTKHADCLKLIAVNTGENSSVVKSYISDLDNSSFTLCWEYSDSSPNEEMIFTFKKSLSTKTEIMSHISELVDSAITDLKV